MGVRVVRHVLLLGVLLVFWVVPGSCLARGQCACPDRVHLRSADVDVKDTSSELKPYVADSMVRLTGGSVYDGPPEERAELIPYSGTKIKNGERYEWRFNPASEYKRNVWISCDYADGLIQLVKPIGQDIKKCTATIREIGKPKKTEVIFSWE